MSKCILNSIPQESIWCFCHKKICRRQAGRCAQSRSHHHRLCEALLWTNRCENRALQLLHPIDHQIHWDFRKQKNTSKQTLLNSYMILYPFVQKKSLHLGFCFTTASGCIQNTSVPGTTPSHGVPFHSKDAGLQLEAHRLATRCRRPTDVSDVERFERVPNPWRSHGFGAMPRVWTNHVESVTAWFWGWEHTNRGGAAQTQL